MAKTKDELLADKAEYEELLITLPDNQHEERITVRKKLIDILTQISNLNITAA